MPDSRIVYHPATMDANFHDDDEQVFAVPVELGAPTLRLLVAFARLTGQTPIAAAERLLEDLLHDGELWNAAEDAAGVEPMEEVNASQNRTHH